MRRLTHSLSKFLILFLVPTFSFASLSKVSANNLPVSATITDSAQKASVATEYVFDPSILSILALSVAAITLIRRRGERQ